MKSDVRRVFVEKRDGFNTESVSLLNNFKENLKMNNLINIRILNRYDVSHISNEDFEKSVVSIFSETNQDMVYYDSFDYGNNRVLAVEYLPGQYDQRADSAAQCIQIITGKEKPIVKYARVLILEGNITDDQYKSIIKYYVNPVDSRLSNPEKPETLDEVYPEAEPVDISEGFINKSPIEIEDCRLEMGLAMSTEDLLFCQEYFKNTEKRNPTITEIKVIDTYWSDHCRHTTFSTVIENIEFENGKITEEIKNTYNEYLNSRNYVYAQRNKDISLMDIATIGAKELRKKGLLDDLEISDEINACSIVVNVEIDGKDEEWLVMFKNETHNHPTEIEPFGGAATCLGGAIRDPLSGRSYVYQAMRVTGSADPRQKIEDALPGKLPQRKITTEAATGYSSYGNQIGLSAGHIHEIYHPDYVAKRMEIGAVISAAPKSNVLREEPEPGDVIILLGGRTGRDGLGGATGSSKVHTEESIEVCGSEVQKGNAPTERKIQRLFRNPNVSRLIKKCNDFGAGGVSVAIGELADGLNINLDLVPKKYEGLDGTEFAISESQERMAVVIRKCDVEKFSSYAHEENLESTPVTVVTDDRRLKMTWRNERILDISRDFLDTNGVKQKINAVIKEPDNIDTFKNRSVNLNKDNLKDLWIENLKDLNVACQKGMVEKFDSTVGAGTVLMPFGGKTQLTPSEGMAAKIPVQKGITNTCTLMAHGFDPYLSTMSPYHGAMYAVIHSVAKIVAMGGNYRNIRLTFQEYFEKLNKDSKKWGKPISALLGAYKVQKELETPSIGGKDSMSGTFMDLNVPPTLVSFAVVLSNVKHVISTEFKKANSKVVLISLKKNNLNIPDFDDLKNKYDEIYKLAVSKRILSAHTVGYGGIAAAISKMSFGNEIGFKTVKNQIISSNSFFDANYGDIILEVEDTAFLEELDFKEIGETTSEKQISVNDSFVIGLHEMRNAWMEPLNEIYPIKKDVEGKIRDYFYNGGNIIKGQLSIAKPKVFIPAFPGTNCEYDTKRAFDRAGADAEIFVFKNLSQNDIKDSIKEMEKRIRQSQIIAFPGGFSAGDEPEGSGKFIAAVFRNEILKDAVHDLLKNRDGLIIGICNGFQALIKLGLVPFGEIVDMKEDYPTLTYNKIARHISGFGMTKVVSNLSPWFNGCNLGDIHYMPLSHGEGRFAANEDWINKLKENGQIATQYVDSKGNPTYDGLFNPNGSVEAIESITSPDGRVLGKMGHSERLDKDIYLNIPGNKEQFIFESGVKYFK